jgi:hypothetical protein
MITPAEQMKRWNDELQKEAEGVARKEADESMKPRKKYTLTVEQQGHLDELAHQMLKHFDEFTFEEVIRFGKKKSEHLEHNPELIRLWAADFIADAKKAGTVIERPAEFSAYDYSTFFVVQKYPKGHKFF